MPRQAKNIIVTYKGEGVNVHYWAGGKGRKVKGYLTSYRQLRSRLDKHFHAHSLELYTVVDRKALHITSESRLKQALATTPSGGYLFVHVFGHRDLYHTPKMTERSPSPVTQRVEVKATLQTKRRPSANAKTAQAKRLEKMFPAQGK